jgi:hypothetical protein
VCREEVGQVIEEGFTGLRQQRAGVRETEQARVLAVPRPPWLVDTQVWTTPRDEGVSLCGESTFRHYNHIHRRSGIDPRAAASVHFGSAGEVRRERVHTLPGAHTAHRNRFRRGSNRPSGKSRFQ